MTHYEQLGINPDATPEEIKRAYRARANQAHPDKGGSAEEFAPVSQAYKVLSDPSRRLLYDATGQDTELPIEKEVEQILIGLFNDALQSNEDIEVLKLVRDRVKVAGQWFEDAPFAEKSVPE